MLYCGSLAAAMLLTPELGLPRALPARLSLLPLLLLMPLRLVLRLVLLLLPPLASAAEGTSC
jgi:hypothetical protein